MRRRLVPLGGSALAGATLVLYLDLMRTGAVQPLDARAWSVVGSLCLVVALGIASLLRARAGVPSGAAAGLAAGLGVLGLLTIGVPLLVAAALFAVDARHAGPRALVAALGGFAALVGGLLLLTA